MRYHSRPQDPASPPGVETVDLAGAMVIGVDRTLDDDSNDRLRLRCMDLIAAAKLQAPELNIETEHVLHVVIQECKRTDAPVVYRCTCGAPMHLWRTDAPVVYRCTCGVPMHLWCTDAPVVYLVRPSPSATPPTAAAHVSGLLVCRGHNFR